MKNHYYSDYLDNDTFLETVEKYITENDSDLHEIQSAIRCEVSSLLSHMHGDKYEINDSIAHAKSLLDVLVHINDTIDKEEQSLYSLECDI